MEWFVSIIKEYPFLSILIISLVLTLILTWTYKKLTNQEKTFELKEKQKELQNRIKNEKDQDKIMEINKEMMQISMEMMKMSFKPMLITFIPVILIFTFLRAEYATANIGDIISWGKNIPIFGTGAGWFLCYIVLSFGFSMIFNNLFDKIYKKKLENKKNKINATGEKNGERSSTETN